MSFKDKVVLVTGASSGIGAAIAVAFNAEGARVVIVGRKEPKLAAVAARCNNPLVLRAEVTNDDDIQRIINQTIETFGQLDILVNNAGTIGHASLLNGDIMKIYDDVMSVNLRAVIHLTSLAIPHLIKTKGNIINISSIFGKFQTRSSFMTYAISKAGLNKFGKFAAAELAPHGVRVNTVSPGPVNTDLIENSGIGGSWDDFKKFTALDRVSDPEEMANLVLYLASEKAKCITGSNYICDNGALVKEI